MNHPSLLMETSEQVQPWIDQLLRKVEEKIIQRFARLESITANTIKEEFATVRKEIGLADFREFINADPTFVSNPPSVLTEAAFSSSANSVAEPTISNASSPLSEIEDSIWARELGRVSAKVDLDQIAFRWDDAGSGGLKVLVLLPTSEQLEDMQTDHPEKPAVLHVAEAQGALVHGVCKIVIPEEARPLLPTNNAPFTVSGGCSSYTPTDLGSGFWRLDPQLSRGAIHRPIRLSERVEDLRLQLRSGQALDSVAYATDVPANTDRDRKKAGLPLHSPIAQLSGDRLDTTRHRLAGMHSTSKFEGTPGAPFCWHIEHCGTSSFNYLYSGEKEWHVVPPASKRNAESVFRRLPLSKAAQRGCPQFMRHDAVFGTQELSLHQIPIRTFRQFAGDIVIVFSNAYHSGHTVAYSIADARNYADDHWSTSEADFCNARCPDGSILHRHMRSRGPNAQIPEDEESAPENDECAITSSDLRPNKRPTEVTPYEESKIRKTKHHPYEISEVVRRVRKADTLCSVPPFLEESMPTPENLLLVSAIRSRLAIALFRDIVKEWRTVPSSHNQSGESRCQRLGRLIDNAEKSSLFSEFRGRIGRAWLAAELDSSVPAGFAKVDGVKRASKRKELGWSQQKLDYQLSEGRKWNRVCGGNFKGLLGFIFTTHRNAFQIRPCQYLDLGRRRTSVSKLEEFHGLLCGAYTQALCKVGRAFESAMVDPNPCLEFKWETIPGSRDWTKLPEPDLLSCMQVYEPVTTNLYDPTEFPEWPRPQGWPDEWAWPANPLTEGVVVGCDECQQRDCRCLTRPPKPIPSIRHYGNRGLGLQAVGRTPGQVVYKKSDTIGWLFGKITPPNPSHRDRCVEVGRPDIQGEPIVCHLECDGSSNLFRLLNHDCSPVAELRARRISSCYVLAVVAKESITHGMEITISYSRKHYGLECLCGTCESRALMPEIGWNIGT